MNSKETFNNWAGPNKLDITCLPNSEIGMIGSLFFFGLAISSALIPPISDKYGRKWNFYICFVIQTVCYILLFQSKSFNFTKLLYFIIGICAGSFISVCPTYMNEFLPTQNQNLITSLLNSADALIIVIHAIYYQINNDWIPIHAFGVISSFVLLWELLSIPESPKYLYAKKDFHGAREIFMIIAKRNGVENYEDVVNSIRFDTEYIG